MRASTSEEGSIWSESQMKAMANEGAPSEAGKPPRTDTIPRGEWLHTAQAIFSMRMAL